MLTFMQVYFWISLVIWVLNALIVEVTISLPFILWAAYLIWDWGPKLKRRTKIKPVRNRRKEVFE